jgi:hypothetical protein
MDGSGLRDPERRAAQAIARVGWRAAFQRLVRYACVLGYAAPDADTRGVEDAADRVQTLFVRALAGELTWKLPPDATDDRIVGHFCKRLEGMRSNQRQHDAIACPVGDEVLADRPDEDADPEEAASWTRALSARQEALQGDTEALKLLAAYIAGYVQRKDAADHLGWNEREVKTVRMRMMRCFRDKGFATITESEDEPPSSGPQGSEDEPQAPEERQGAPREPARSAQHPRRRR